MKTEIYGKLKLAKICLKKVTFWVFFFKLSQNLHYLVKRWGKTGVMLAYDLKQQLKGHLNVFSFCVKLIGIA